MIKIPAENATIYCRDTSDWAQKHTVYTFDYVAEPDIDTSDGVKTRVKFYISENRLKVAWTSFEPVGNEHWEYLEKKAYEIPIAENADERAKSAGEASQGMTDNFVLSFLAGDMCPQCICE